MRIFFDSSTILLLKNYSFSNPGSSMQSLPLSLKIIFFLQKKTSEEELLNVRGHYLLGRFMNILLGKGL